MSLQGTCPDLHLTLQVRPLCPFYAFTLEPLMTVRPPTVNLCLQRLLAVSRSAMVQAWKTVARLQADLKTAAQKSKGTTNATFRHWADSAG